MSCPSHCPPSVERELSPLPKSGGGSEILRAHFRPLRAGFLTSAARRGASVFKMRDVSRHKSMDVLQAYVRARTCCGTTRVLGCCRFRVHHLAPKSEYASREQEQVMANEGLINLLGWCKRERESLQMQREMLQSGRGRSASYPAPPARIRTCTFMHTALTSGA
jgi:hypothetical protein